MPSAGTTGSVESIALDAAIHTEIHAATAAVATTTANIAAATAALATANATTVGAAADTLSAASVAAVATSVALTAATTAAAAAAAATIAAATASSFLLALNAAADALDAAKVAHVEAHAALVAATATATAAVDVAAVEAGAAVTAAPFPSPPALPPLPLQPQLQSQLRRLRSDEPPRPAHVLSSAFLPGVGFVNLGPDGIDPIANEAARTVGSICGCGELAVVTPEMRAARRSCVDAGAVPPLVALLRCGPWSSAAEAAAEALSWIGEENNAVNTLKPEP
jgi:hypothetical protein